MELRPLHDRVVVRRLDQEATSKGGVIISDAAQDKPMQGEVVAASPGGRDERGGIAALDVHAGDRVPFGKWSGTGVKLGGEDLLVLGETDLMGVLQGAPAAASKAA